MTMNWSLLGPAIGMDYAGKVQQGFESGQRVAETLDARKRQAQARQAIAALQGDPGNPKLMQELYAADPQLGAAIEDQLYQRAERQRATDFRGGTADMLMALDGRPQAAMPQQGPVPQQGMPGAPQFATPSSGAINSAPRAPMQVPPQTPVNGEPAPMPAQADPTAAARERAIRADPTGFLSFQGTRLDLDAKQLKGFRDLNDAAMQILGGVHDQASYEAAKARATVLYASHGQDLSQLGLPDQYSPELVETLRLQGMDTSKQLLAIARENRLDWDIEDDRLDNQRSDRNTQSLIEQRRNPRAPRGPGAPKPPTPTTVIGAIMDKQARGEALTPAERQTLTEHRAPKGRASGSSTRDGAIIVDRRTGKRKILRDGKWVDLP